MHYPDESYLVELEKYDWVKRDVDKFLDRLRENWEFADAGYFKLSGKKVLRLELHTGGWSGNEDIIHSLKKNFLFWSMCWQKSTTGGHYYFKVKR